MRDMQSDQDLLEAFVKSNDERAFRCVAERYSGLIYHTALRSLNDRTLAQDVAQRVLSVLAKKASQVARGGVPLPAWLHRTAVLEAKSVRRSEFRHQRKKEALMRAPSESPDSNDPAWKEALPHLDAAIDSLPEADRRVILLHFVSEMTFPEIALRVGKSAAAVQKQSRRALETLQRILGRRGIALSVGILTAGLTAEMAKAGPVLLLPALASLSTVGQTTTSVIVVNKTTLAAIGASLLLCGIPLAYQQSTLNDLELRLGAASGSSSDIRSASKAASAKSLSMVERLARDLKAQDRDVPRYVAAVDCIQGLRNDELIALIKEAVVSPMPVPDGNAVFNWLFDTLARRDPELALNILMDSVPSEYIRKSEGARSLLVNSMRRLSERDGQKALDWFNGHLDQIRSLPEWPRSPTGTLENHIRVELAYGLLASDPIATLDVLKPVPAENLATAFRSIAEDDPFPKEKISGFVRTVRELLPEKESTKAVSRLVSRMIPSGPGSLPYESVDALLASASFSPSERDAITSQAGVQRISIQVHDDGLEAGILQYKAWLETRFVEGIDRKVGETLGQMILSWQNQDDQIYKVMLNRQTLGLGDETVVGLLSTAGQKYDEAQVRELADSLSDQELARELISQVNKRRTE